MGTETMKSDIAGIDIEVHVVTANQAYKCLNKVQASVIRQSIRTNDKDQTHLSQQEDRCATNTISSHAGSAISVKTSSAIAGISLSPRARSC
jgi:hypothetical protein